MKRLFSALGAWIFIFSFLFMGFCADFGVDGKLNNAEWDNTKVQMLVASGEESNCGVTFACVRAAIRNDENAVYLGFTAICDELCAESKLCGVSVKIADSQAMKACADNTPCEYDTDLYSFNSCVVIGEKSDFVCEVRIGFKMGVPASIPVELRIIDAQGMPSTVYSYMIENDEYSETETKELGETKTPEIRATKAAKAAKTTAKRAINVVTTAEETRTRYSRPNRTRRETTIKRTTTEKKTESVSEAATEPAAEVVTASTEPFNSVKAIETYVTAELPTVDFHVDTTESKRKQNVLTLACGAGIGALVIWALLPDRKGNDKLTD